MLDFLFRNSIENPAVPISSDAALEYLIGAQKSSAGINVTAEKAFGLTGLWRGINTLSGDLAKVPIDVLHNTYDETSEDGKPPARDHPVYRVLRRTPGGTLTPFRFKKTVFFHAIMRGNGFALITRRNYLRDGAPMRLTILPPTPITKPIIADGEKWYVTMINGEELRFPAEDVIHIAGLSYDGLEGLDVLTVMVDPLGLQLATQRHAATYFKDGTQSPAVLISPKKLDDTERKLIRQNWAKMVTGEAAHQVAVLWGAQWDMKTLGVDPQKAQLLESREFGLIDVANILCMPPHKCGHPARTSYSSLEQENMDYLTTTLDQWFVNMEEELELKLLTEEEQEKDLIDIEFNRKALLRVDFVNRIMGYAKLKEIGVINSNQIAKRENLPPLGDQGSRYFVPGNWVAIGDDGFPAFADGPSNTLSARAVEAHKAAIADRARQLILYAARSISDAAQKETEFLKWLVPFLRQYESKMIQALDPPVVAFYASANKAGAGFRTYVAVKGHVESCRAELARAIEQTGKESFAVLVNRITSEWPRRAEELATSIVEYA